MRAYSDRQMHPCLWTCFSSGRKHPQTILAEYARITGFPEMVPLWSFGYQQSHRTLGSPEEIIQEANTFRQKRLPCDAMIYLGTGFCPEGWNTDKGEFTWNSRMFPDPPKAIEELHAQHFKVVLHIVIEESASPVLCTTHAARPLYPAAGHPINTGHPTGR